MPAFRKVSPAEIAVFDQPPIGPVPRLRRSTMPTWLGLQPAIMGRPR